ncbi:MAG: DNA cytosine methyltransferase [Planctomycetes bacterium]|nr:DNA cytosine methyltransferase [Planctomycetota bacterium]
MTTATYTFLDSFCGPGGMSLGLEQAGFVPGLAFDLDEWAVRTHRHNLAGECIVADAREVEPRELLERLGVERGELALFAGGPPCQGFSKQKRGAHLGDARNDLVARFAELVRELVPRTFLFENVAIFGQKRGRPYLRFMQEHLSEYALFPHFYNCADYGLAQTRERFVVVGVRRDQGVAFSPPAPTAERWRTVGETLAGLPEPPEDYSIHPDFPNHQRARVTALNIERFSHVPQGGGWRDIPEALRLACHQSVDTSRGGWPDVYGRLEWDGQCPTLTGGFDSFTRGRYGHPLQDRPLTPREAARLQGFPDHFEFLGTRQHQRSQIGNVVPPPLAQAVGRELLTCLRVADGLERPRRRSRRVNAALDDQRELF